MTALAKIQASHPYFAKFDYNIPLQLIEERTSEGAVVLDPFCGSGTTPLTAAAVGRHSVGIDANPLACLIARVKTSPLQRDDLMDLRRLATEAATLGDEAAGRSSLFAPARRLRRADVPAIHNIAYWFESHVIEELQVAKALVETIERTKTRDAAFFAFSRIIVRCSNQAGESKYRRVDKGHEPGTVFRLLAESLNATIPALESIAQTILPNVSATIINADSRSHPLVEGSCDLVVTSPPYLNAWDYSLYQKFRMLWLGWDPKPFEKIEIGNHLRALHRGPTETDRYSRDMAAVFANLARALKPGSTCVFVNGESVVQGKAISTDDILIAAAREVGFSVESISHQDILGPHFGNHGSLRARNVSAPIKRRKRESTIVFVRD